MENLTFIGSLLLLQCCAIMGLYDTTPSTNTSGRCDGQWSTWYDYDDPTGDGDFETLQLLQDNCGACKNPTAIEARLVIGGAPYTAGGEIVSISVTNGFSCKNKNQPDRECKDYEVRLCCPATTTKCDGLWTVWYDRDNPGGDGDFEDLGHLRKENPGKICPKPSSVDARLVNGKGPYTDGDNVVIISPALGLHCRNRHQIHNKWCKDYEVRFCCPKPKCDGTWTPWYDRDNPGGVGDFETLKDLRKKYNICETPSLIEARLVPGGEPYEEGDDSVEISPTYGLSCVNEVQTDFECKDYEVRFCCPKPCDGKWTRWYDRDDPSGSGDYENLASLKKENPGRICDVPSQIQARLVNNKLPYTTSGELVVIANTYGLTCLNRNQKDRRCEDYEVRFCCKEPIKCDDRDWTPWIDIDDPSGRGDYEQLNAIRDEHHVCEEPAKVEARVVGSQIPHTHTGELVTINTANGFYCVNNLQPDRVCMDYEVRFCCPKPKCDGVWTDWLDRDNPGGYGDYENRILLQMNHKICDKPSVIDARIAGTNAPYTTGGDTLTISPTHGLTCVNADQPDQRCNDYQVRFCCPRTVADEKCDGNWTMWFNEDDPTGPGDFETVNDLRAEYPEQLCKQPSLIQARTCSHVDYIAAGEAVNISPTIGFICINTHQPDQSCLDYEVRFCCPPVVQCDGKWTKWYDTDDPTVTGDWETIGAVVQRDPSVCGRPLAVDARLTDGRHYTAANEILSVGAHIGLVCQKRLQPDGLCEDYEVRFCCPENDRNEI